MIKYIMIVLIMMILLCGCTAIPKFIDAGRQGLYSTPGQMISEGVTAAVKPAAGETWAGIIGMAAGAIIGGFGVHKRKKWLDTPCK